jgi:hypothetical protein
MGYKMKKFPGFGNEKSPAKSIISAQKELDKVELDFREPGWAQVARSIHEGATNVLSKGTGDDPEVDETENGNGKTSDASSVTDIIKGMEVDELSGGEEINPGMS